MGMLEYLAKIFRNKFFDTQKKYQENYERQNETEIEIKEAEHSVDNTQTVEQKDDNLSEDVIKDIEK